MPCATRTASSGRKPQPSRAAWMRRKKTSCGRARLLQVLPTRLSWSTLHVGSARSSEDAIAVVAPLAQTRGADPRRLPHRGRSLSLCFRRGLGLGSRPDAPPTRSEVLCCGHSAGATAPRAQIWSAAEPGGATPSLPQPNAFPAWVAATRLLRSGRIRQGCECFLAFGGRSSRTRPSRAPYEASGQDAADGGPH